MSGELLEHVEEGLEVDDRPVGAGSQRLLESVAPEAEAVDHVVGVDDARHLVRRQIAVLIPVFRTQSRTHFTESVLPIFFIDEIAVGAAPAARRRRRRRILQMPGRAAGAHRRRDAGGVFGRFRRLRRRGRRRRRRDVAPVLTVLSTG